MLPIFTEKLKQSTKVIQPISGKSEVQIQICLTLNHFSCLKTAEEIAVPGQMTVAAGQAQKFMNKENSSGNGNKEALMTETAQGEFSDVMTIHCICGVPRWLSW